MLFLTYARRDFTRLTSSSRSSFVRVGESFYTSLSQLVMCPTVPERITAAKILPVLRPWQSLQNHIDPDNADEDGE